MHVTILARLQSKILDRIGAAYYLGKKFSDTYEFMGVIDRNIIEFIILLIFMIFVSFYLSNNPAVSWQNDLVSLFTW